MILFSDRQYIKLPFLSDLFIVWTDASQTYAVKKLKIYGDVCNKK